MALVADLRRILQKNTHPCATTKMTRRREVTHRLQVPDIPLSRKLDPRKSLRLISSLPPWSSEKTAMSDRSLARADDEDEGGVARIVRPPPPAGDVLRREEQEQGQIEVKLTPNRGLYRQIRLACE